MRGPNTWEDARYISKLMSIQSIQVKIDIFSRNSLQLMAEIPKQPPGWMFLKPVVNNVFFTISAGEPDF